MGLTDPYLDLDSLKARIGSGITGTSQDPVLLEAIKAASRQIDGWTGRRFGKSDEATAKYVTAREGDLLMVPDFVSIDEIATDDGTRTYATVWEATDFDPFPYDAADEEWPYTAVRTAPYGLYGFPYPASSYPRGVRITAIWGWPAVPDAIVQATALQALRLYKRKDAPFGVIGSPELGQLQTISKIDPDVMTLIAPFKVTVF